MEAMLLFLYCTCYSFYLKIEKASLKNVEFRSEYSRFLD
jgi:hypothetical protein